MATYHKSLAIVTPHVVNIDEQRGMLYDKDFFRLTPHAVTFKTRIGQDYDKDLSILTPHVLTFNARLGLLNKVSGSTPTPHIITFSAVKRPGVRTCVIPADIKKMKPKPYIYHGQKMSCVQPPQPKPRLCNPLVPVVNPTTLDYEADCFPENNPDPMVCSRSGGGGSRAISDGVFWLTALPTSRDGTFEQWGWNCNLHFTEQMWWFTEFVFGVPLAPPTASGQYVVEQAFLRIPANDNSYIKTRKWFDSVWNGSQWGWKYNAGESYTALTIYYVGGVVLPVTPTHFLHIWKDAGIWHLAFNGTEYGSGFSSGWFNRYTDWQLTSSHFSAQMGIDYSRVWLDTTPS